MKDAGLVNTKNSASSSQYVGLFFIYLQSHVLSVINHKYTQTPQKSHQLVKKCLTESHLAFSNAACSIPNCPNEYQHLAWELWTHPGMHAKGHATVTSTDNKEGNVQSLAATRWRWHLLVLSEDTILREAQENTQSQA